MNPMILKENIRRRLALLMAYAMTFTTLLTGVEPLPVYAADTDISGGVLDPTHGVYVIDSSVVQGSEVAEGGTIDASKKMTVTLELKVPVLHDDDNPTEYVKGGDEITVKLPGGYVIPSAQLEDKDVFFNGKAVAKVLQYEAGADSVRIKFTDVVDKNTVSNVPFKMSFSMQSTKTNESSSDLFEETTIFEKTYKLKIPSGDRTYSLKKEGELNGDTIDWTITVNAYEYDNYVFKDDLENVGTLIDGTFKVDGVSASTDPGKNISYTFSEGTASGEHVITFSTKLSEEQDKDVVNHAQLVNPEGEEVASGDETIHYNTALIDKWNLGEDSTISGDKRVIPWIIRVDPSSYGEMKNVVVTDLLGNGNAKGWEVKTVSVSDDDDDYSLIDSSKYRVNDDGNLVIELGNISKEIYIKVVTEVPAGRASYENAATVEADGVDGIEPVTDTYEPEGSNVVKWGDDYDYETHTVDWTVEIGQSVGYKYALDVIIEVSSTDYERGSFIWEKATGSENEGTSFNIDDGFWDVASDAVSFGHRYVEGSFEDINDNVKHDIYNIKSKSGVVVGKAIIVEGDGEDLAENPRAESPERISRGMRHAEVRRRGGQLAGILQANRRPEREEIDDKRYESGRPECRPV